MYTISDLGSYVVFKHKKNNRYYVKDKSYQDDRFEIFKTSDLNKAKDVLESTRNAWNDNFHIVDGDSVII